MSWPDAYEFVCSQHSELAIAPKLSKCLDWMLMQAMQRQVLALRLDRRERVSRPHRPLIERASV